MSRIAATVVLLGLLLMPGSVSAQNGAQGFVPRHEKLVRAARERARRDLGAASAVRGEGREAGMRADVSTRLASATFQAPADVGPVAEGPYYEELPPYHEHGGPLAPIHDGCAGGCGGCGPGGCLPPAPCGPMGCGPGACAPSGCGCVGPCQCGPCACGVPNCCGICFPRLFQCRVFEVMGGVQGFTGPLNRGGAGSFGHYGGVNFGTRIPCLACGQLGAQIGARSVNSNYSGAAITPATREQVFVTAGLFRRVDCGLQGGVVVDFLNDDWYADLDLSQLRGEASWVMGGTGELGFHFRANLGETDIAALPVNNQVAEVARATDLYALFYRHRFLPCGAGEARMMGGLSTEGDGLLSAEFRLPLRPSVSIEGGYTYLIPNEPTLAGGTENEAWNVFVGLVWQPGCPDSTARNYYRPLMRVADNGSFLFDVQ